MGLLVYECAEPPFYIPCTLHNSHFRCSTQRFRVAHLEGLPRALRMLWLEQTMSLPTASEESGLKPTPRIGPHQSESSTSQTRNSHSDPAGILAKLFVRPAAGLQCTKRRRPMTPPVSLKPDIYHNTSRRQHYPNP